MAGFGALDIDIFIASGRELQYKQEGQRTNRLQVMRVGCALLPVGMGRPGSNEKCRILMRQ